MMVQRVSRADFDRANPYVVLFSVRAQPMRYQQAIPRHITRQMVDQPLYVGQPERLPLWHPYRSTWVQLAYVVLITVIIAAVAHLCGADVQLGTRP